MTSTPGGCNFGSDMAGAQWYTMVHNGTVAADHSVSQTVVIGRPQPITTLKLNSQIQEASL